MFDEMDILKRLFAELEALYPEMISIRRYLHQYPELSFKEEKTPVFIADYHRQLDHEVREGVGGRGVVAVLRGSNTGRTVALRADFDALPITEEADVPYKSRVPGVMHACGHDGHTASLLGLAKAMHRLREELSGTIIFIHQHAEEIVPGGAKAMIEDGCLDGVDYIFGTHLWATEPLGRIQVRPGNIMAASDKFEIEIIGKGGHGGYPHETIDPIVLASEIVVLLQHIVSRRVNPLEPAVLSVGSFHGGESFNVIADTVTLGGTVRAYNDTIRKHIEEEMKRILEGVCRSSGASYRLRYEQGYPALVNHPDEAVRVSEIARTVPGVTEVVSLEPRMAAEDFAFYLQKVKGSYFFTGAQDPAKPNPYPQHHPKFNIDERALLIASSTLGAIAVDFASREP
jgi:amidohydrolase